MENNKLSKFYGSGRIRKTIQLTLFLSSNSDFEINTQ